MRRWSSAAGCSWASDRSEHGQGARLFQQFTSDDFPGEVGHRASLPLASLRFSQGYVWTSPCVGGRI